jgi:hypothetical protein
MDQGWVSFVLLVGKGRIASAPEEMWVLGSGSEKVGPAPVSPAPSLTCISPHKPHTPDPHSRVCLTSSDSDDPLSSYINANYIRVCSPILVVFP